MKKGYLVLQDGRVFEGVRFGANADTIGELVFTTGMCGYIETLTDPSYAGQIVMQTYPLIGNYGIIREDFEGNCCVKGYVVREYCDAPSNFRTDCDLDTYLKEQNVPGLYGVDTRELTRIIREHGVMNATICDEVPADLKPVETYAVVGVVEAVTCKEPTVHPAVGEEMFKVSLLDYGAKNNIIRELQKRGCTVTVLPATTSAEDILTSDPDGVMLSNGPGDPAENTGIIREITEQMTGIFAQQFQLLNESFQTTFQELFGGGQATLELEDEKDILNCGIEIRAQPPGKTLKNISLLSGGEKAFVAIALYFAILKVHPTPFCVMDEIEAALDEPNVIRVARYMRRLAGRTQFIVITHRRGTMEEADVLYGVTMQEQGVSKILTINLNDMAKELKIGE